MQRKEHEDWLVAAAERDPDGWEARFIGKLGLEGALDLLAAQVGDVHEIDLRHRPFAGNDELKWRVYRARVALSELAQLAYQVGFELDR